MSWSGFSKVLLGLLVAIGLIAGGGFIAARIVIAKYNAAPAKPIYPNDAPAAKSSNATTTAAKANKTAESSSTEPSAKPLPPGATEARVTQPIGLILRDGPNGSQIGGIEYNNRVIVLETSPDGGWQKVRLPVSEKEGWVKAGNIE
ncbi:MAG: SH3 domain-containing protein [Myxacorys californica WJT36-NPBG1]|jgi:hypothetical protein|nr:SH3 domain-containing protein [Myxacorys californica WJT36-NPBG1]